MSGGDKAMKRRIEQMKKRLAEQRRLWHHNHVQPPRIANATMMERFGIKRKLMISDMPATH
jgi:hypothetical protein